MPAKKRAETAPAKDDAKAEPIPTMKVRPVIDETAVAEFAAEFAERVADVVADKVAAALEDRLRRMGLTIDIS